MSLYAITAVTFATIIVAVVCAMIFGKRKVGTPAGLLIILAFVLFAVPLLENIRVSWDRKTAEDIRGILALQAMQIAGQAAQISADLNALEKRISSKGTLTEEYKQNRSIQALVFYVEDVATAFATKDWLLEQGYQATTMRIDVQDLARYRPAGGKALADGNIQITYADRTKSQTAALALRTKLLQIQATVQSKDKKTPDVVALGERLRNKAIEENVRRPTKSGDVQILIF